MLLVVSLGCGSTAFQIYDRTDESDPNVGTINTSPIKIKNLGFLGSHFLLMVLKYKYFGSVGTFTIRFIYWGKDLAYLEDVSFSVDGESEVFKPIYPTERKGDFSGIEEDMTVEVHEDLFKKIQSAKSVSIEIGSRAIMDIKFPPDIVEKINSFYATVNQRRKKL